MNRSLKISAAIMAVAVAGTIGAIVNHEAQLPQAIYRQSLLEQATQIADTNKNHVLELDETAKMLRSIGYEGMLKESVRYKLVVYDKPGIDIEEILPGFGGSPYYYVSLPQSKVEEFIEEHKSSN